MKVNTLPNICPASASELIQHVLFQLLILFQNQVALKQQSRSGNTGVQNKQLSIDDLVLYSHLMHGSSLWIKMRIYYIHYAVSFCFPFPLQLHTTLYLQLTDCCNDGICSETAGLKNLGNEGPPNRLPGSLFVQ